MNSFTVSNDVIYQVQTDAQEYKLINENKSLIIFFGSNGCGHCRNIKPLFEQLANANRSIRFAYVESSVVKCNDLHEGVPQFVAYRNGQPVDKIIGADPTALQEMVRSMK